MEYLSFLDVLGTHILVEISRNVEVKLFLRPQ